MSASLAWLILATLVAVSWYSIREIFCSSHGALIQVASPIMDLAVPVLVIGGLFHLGLSTRHVGASTATAQAPAAAAPAPAAPAPAQAAPAPAAPPPSAAPPAPVADTSSLSLLGRPQSNSIARTGVDYLRFPIAVRECPANTCRVIGYVSRSGYATPMRWGSGPDSGLDSTGTWVRMTSTGEYCVTIIGGCSTPRTQPVLTGWIQRLWTQ
ncbi:MAG: hypothetical protein SXG53_28010 [Pseudomonadota bacterium]|nr:hypothetical protein [Pseudomonadota bacterium]